ncbi:MAG: TlpA disulfide reductase family protein [Flavobacterium sp.]|nr:TlpA disulfide reductase family protein [Flavobacterium sp.]
MKNIFLFIIVAAGLVSFRTLADKDYAITGSATGMENGLKVYLVKPDDLGKFVKLDSAKVENGVFSFKGKTPEPSIHFLEFDKIEDKLVFILEEGKINFTIYKDSIGKSKIGGTRSNDDLQRFNTTAIAIQNKMMDFQNKNTEKWNEAQTKKDTVTTNLLIKELKTYQDQMVALSTAFPSENPKSFLSVLLMDNMFSNPDVDIEKIKKTFNSLDASIKNTKAGKSVQTKINGYVSLNIGNVAPDFSAPNPEGKKVSLKESLGKVTIIDFWASWCGPCRRENPNVVQLYNDFHAKGLNIISVSLDKDGTKWKEAIAKDGLTWTHISNLLFWEDPIALQYNIKSIPATFILDANGKIIAKDLRGSELRAKISEYLAK